MAVKLGEMLLKAGLISQKQLEEALEAQRENGEKLGFNLIRLGYVKEDDITQLLSEQYGVPSINLRHFEIDEAVINLIPSEMTMSPLTRWLSIADPVGRYAEHKQVKALDEAEVFYYQGTEFIWEVEEALKRSGKNTIIKDYTVSIKGDII